MKSFFYELWTTPYPEFIVGKIGKLFEGIKPRRRLSRHMYLILSVIICLVSIGGIFYLGGTLNPVDLFLEIPVYSFIDFLRGIPNYTSLTWWEFIAFSAVVTYAVIYLVHLLIFKQQEYPGFSLNGMAYTAMNFFLTIVINMVCMNVFTYIHIHYITDFLVDPATLAMVLLSNFGLYFVMRDAFEIHLSFSLISIICNILGLQKFSLGLFHYIIVSVIIKAVTWVIGKTGIWNSVIRFIGKWCYTFKYIFRMVFFFYFLAFLVVGGWMIPGYPAKMKKWLSDNEN